MIELNIDKLSTLLWFDSQVVHCMIFGVVFGCGMSIHYAVLRQEKGHDKSTAVCRSSILGSEFEIFIDGEMLAGEVALLYK